MSGVTTHVLDTSRGQPAAGIQVQLETMNGKSENEWSPLGDGITNNDGRVSDLVTSGIGPGHYRISFLVGDYFESRNVEAFYPVVRIEFEIKGTDQHYHVPLLLNPFGYSTYRGS